MHYIRFLKPPRLDASRGLSSKITVTTDLGESFLLADVTLVAYLEDAAGNPLKDSSKHVPWKGSTGMRALEVVLPVPRKATASQRIRVVIRPVDERYSADDFVKLLEDANVDVEDGVNGRVVTARSKLVDLRLANAPPMNMVDRVFSFRGLDNPNVSLPISEETGESIARHIWDAGLVFSAYLASLHSSNLDPTRRRQTTHLPRLEDRLRSGNLNVLELGAGCGIVGLTLAASHPSLARIILTDLPEANDILTENIAHQASTRQVVTHQNLNWTEPLSQSITSVKFDLILVADCTYNPDVVPSLVKTLRDLVQSGSKAALVCVAMKVRHESEMVFFDLMSSHGFDILERAKIGVPVLGDEGQAIEIFVFGQATR